MSPEAKASDVALDSRSREVLHAVIHHHVATAQPVGSQTLASQYRLGASSATLRNVMAELERLGYLSHPHTSAGRVPTDQGYRAYVDSLTEVQTLTRDERLRIEREYEHRRHEVDEVLRATSALLAQVSHVAGIVLRPGQSEPSGNTVVVEGTTNVMNQPEFADVSRVKSLFQIFEEKRQISEAMSDAIEAGSAVQVRIGVENRVPAIRDFSLVTKTYRIGERVAGVLGILGPKRMDYDKMVSVVDYTARVVDRVLASPEPGPS